MDYYEKKLTRAEHTAKLLLIFGSAFIVLAGVFALLT